MGRSRSLLLLAMAVLALGVVGSVAGKKSAKQKVIDDIETALNDVDQLTDQIRGIRTIYSNSAIHKSATSACLESVRQPRALYLYMRCQGHSLALFPPRSFLAGRPCRMHHIYAQPQSP